AADGGHGGAFFPCPCALDLCDWRRPLRKRRHISRSPLPRSPSARKLRIMERSTIVAFRSGATFGVRRVSAALGLFLCAAWRVTKQKSGGKAPHSKKDAKADTRPSCV